MPGYEVSNHARPGAESRHNLIYWRCGDFAGIGPGAHGRITGDSRTALWTVRDPAAWLRRVAADGHGIEGREVVSPEEQAREYALMSMRLAEGMDRKQFRSLGARLDDARLDELAEIGLVAFDAARVRVTDRGRIVLNSVLARMLD